MPNTFGRSSGAMPMPLSSTADRQARRRLHRRATRIDAVADAVYFAALVSRFDSTCASRSGSAFTCSSSGTSTMSWCRRSSMSGRAVSTAAPTIDCRSVRCLRSCSVPCVMRETSSRSSSSSDMCCTCRSITLLDQRFCASLACLVARDRRGLADRRQRIAQLVRERREEFVLAAVGLEQLALLQLALRDVGEPDREIAIERRGDDVIPVAVAVRLGLALDLPHLVASRARPRTCRNARGRPRPAADVR